MTSLHDAVVQRTVVVSVSRERAFDFFTNRMIEWWPREFTFSEGTLDEIAMDCWSGGRWYERDTGGSEIEWGTVREWQGPERVVLSWKISPERTPEPDESRASEVEVVFSSINASRTRIELEHRHFHRHGQGADVMYAGMGSSEGWTKILDHFASRVVDESEHKF